MDAKTQLLAVIDKLALVVGGLVVVAVVLGNVFGESPAAQGRKDLDKYSGTLTRARDLANEQAPQPEALSYGNVVRTELGGGPLPETWPTWMLHKRPLVLAAKVGEQLPDPPKHVAVEQLSGKGGLGRIEVSWQPSTSNRLVKVTAYHIYRAFGEPADWERVADLEGDATAFADTDIKPKVGYRYRVDSVAVADAEHSVVKRYGFELDEENRVLASQVIGPFETLKDQHIELVSVVPELTIEEIRAGKKQTEAPMAYLKVWRYASSESRWVSSRLLTVEVGEMVGSVEQQGSATHDFSTPWRLERTRRAAVKHISSGGFEVTMEADVAEFVNKSTRETLVLNNKNRDPELERVKSNPDGDTSGGEQKDQQNGE